jgi:hypothetical protein
LGGHSKQGRALPQDGTITPAGGTAFPFLDPHLDQQYQVKDLP